MRVTSNPDRYGNRGFSIVEVMVGLAIGLISMLIVMQVFTTFEGQKRSTTSGADAQTNGGLGIYTMERDIRMAGYGFGAATGCTVQAAQALPAPFSDPLLEPVRIDKTGGRPDTITLLSSNKSSWSVPARYVAPAVPSQFIPGDNLILTSSTGIVAGDMMLIYQNSDCTLLQVSSVDTTTPAAPFIVHDAGDWNGVIAGSPTYTGVATMMDFGNLAGHSYSVDAAGNLVFTSYCAASNGNSACPAADNDTTSQIIATDIVTLQAQYGFDAHADPRTTVNVDTWSNTMVDADGSGTAGDMGDIRRLYAVRLALVARSGLKEKPQPNGVCNTTTTTPTWAGGALLIYRNPDGTTNPDWQCYRYKTFETVIPLRNLIW